MWLASTFGKTLICNYFDLRMVMLSLCVSVVAASTTPHILYIMADDLGWHNVGYHNPNMSTPNLNALVKDGIELDRTYVYHYCRQVA
jgi:hypothetical protein